MSAKKEMLRKLSDDIRANFAVLDIEEIDVESPDYLELCYSVSLYWYPDVEGVLSYVMLKEIELVAVSEKNWASGDALVYYMCDHDHGLKNLKNFLSNFSKEQLNIMLRWLSLVAKPLYNWLCPGDIEEAERHIRDLLEKGLFGKGKRL